METIGEAILRLRRARGWSQSRLAEILNEVSGHPTLNRTEISRWQRGKRTPRFWLAWLATVFDVELAELERLAYGIDAAAGDTVADAVRVAHEWLVTPPPQIVHLATGRRVGVETAAATEHRVVELRRLDDHLGGADTMALVERELAVTETTVHHAAYTEKVGRRLLSSVAELSQLAGWVASDAGEYRRAERWYLSGVRAAHAAQDTCTAANLISSLAYQCANTGRPADAVLLARTALHGATSAAGRVRALLLERIAWAYARAGDVHETDATLADVSEAYGTASGDDPDWTYWLDQGEIELMAGRCHVALHRPLRAVPLLSDAIDRYDQTRERETALYRTWLAEAYLQANELDAARETLDQSAVTAAAVTSERLAARVRDVDALLAARR